MELRQLVCAVVLQLLVLWMGGTEGRSIKYGTAIAEVERDFHPSWIDQACCIVVVAASFAFLIDVSRRLGFLAPAGTYSTRVYTMLFCIVFFSVVKVTVAVLVLIEMVSHEATGIRPFGLVHHGRTRVHYTYSISPGSATFGSGEL